MRRFDKIEEVAESETTKDFCRDKIFEGLEE